MDERQSNIQEGAGLEESRVNTELLDFLNKWSVPVLFLVLVVSLGYMGWNYLQVQERTNRDIAFAEYAAQVEASTNPLPEAVQDIAEKHEGIGSIAPLARLRLGDIYLRAAMSGLEPGSSLDGNGLPESEDDLLDEDGRARYLDFATGAYRAALDATRDTPGKELLAINALYGLAAAAGTAGDRDAAADYYIQAATLADSAGFARLAVVARGRAADLPGLPEMPSAESFLTREQLPRFPGEPPLPGEEEEPEPAISEDDALSLPNSSLLLPGTTGPIPPATDPIEVMPPAASPPPGEGEKQGEGEGGEGGGQSAPPPPGV